MGGFCGSFAFFFLCGGGEVNIANAILEVLNHHESLSLNNPLIIKALFPRGGVDI